MAELKHKSETHQIIGAAMKVHSILGCGFTEKVYQDALEVEFRRSAIPYQREPELHAIYEGVELNSTFKPDFICFDKVIVELKALQELDDQNRAQTINYAKIAKYEVALLINFGDTSLHFERFAVG